MSVPPSQRSLNNRAAWAALPTTTPARKRYTCGRGTTKFQHAGKSYCKARVGNGGAQKLGVHNVRLRSGTSARNVYQAAGGNRFVKVVKNGKKVRHYVTANQIGAPAQKVKHGPAAMDVV